MGSHPRRHKTYIYLPLLSLDIIKQKSPYVKTNDKNSSLQMHRVTILDLTSTQGRYVFQLAIFHFEN